VNSKLTAHLDPRWKTATAIIILFALAAWGIRRVFIFNIENHTTASQFTIAYAVAFAFLVIQMVACHFERPYKGGKEDRTVVVAVPVYNEDVTLLHRNLLSLLTQTRRPDGIYVVDDGSDKADYTELRTWFIQEASRVDVAVQWVKTPNRGKRRAQSEAFKNTPDATIYVTVDSDAILDPNAIEEGLKPFMDRRVQSVCGVVFALNNRSTLLARFTDLLFVTNQLTDRSSMSAVGSVLVNSGVLAFYRAEVIRDNLEGYLNETFLGRPVEFSDDSMLTLYALMRGKTVQQPSSFVFTNMPEIFSHHERQQERWMRGSFIRSWWRLRYLPVMSWGFMRQLLGWVQLAMTSVIFTVLFIVYPMTEHKFIPELVIVPVLIGYGQALRYLTFRRSDMSFKSQFGIYLLAPLSWLWSFIVLRPLRFYCMVTCRKTGWNTRSEIEIDMTERLAVLPHHAHQPRLAASADGTLIDLTVATPQQHGLAEGTGTTS